MVGLALVLALGQATDEHARQVVERMTFPDAAAIKVWTDQGPEYKTVLDVVLKRGHWVAAVKALEERLGPFGDAWAIEVKLSEWGGTHVARGDRIGEKGEIAFNMRRLGEYERKLRDFRKQAEELRKQGKRMTWKVPPIKYERILHHELTHVLQGEYASPGWFHEGLASWMGGDLNYVKAFTVAKKPVQSIEVDLSADPDDEYGRGMLFFLWLEDRVRVAGIKKLYGATVVEGGDWKQALEEATRLEWAKIVEVERAWSAKRAASAE
ncbi:MAG: hypothetical protein HYY16_01630 [Planctomycetes bacterium]|nr:hypothetical protein [Planctomycetota bacterium]